MTAHTPTRETPAGPAGPSAPATAPAVTAARPPHPRWLLRLHGPALYVWAALVAVLALGLLWLWGPLTDAAADAWRQYNACAGNGPCSYDQDAIVTYKSVYNYVTLPLSALPFLVGAWSGAALFGRELEHGTAQLAWTQGLSPTRWLATKLAVPALLVTAGTGVLVTLHRLAWSAGNGRIDTAKTWYDDPTLHANGPTTVAFALAGLAAGALAALLLRRTLPALLLALGTVAAVRFLAVLAMPHLWPGVTRVSPLEDGYRSSGLGIDSGLVTSTGAHIADPGCGPTVVPECRTLYDKLDATGFYNTFHPESHYWPLQLITTALVLAVAAALTIASFALIRRTTATTAASRAAARESAV
ncbi:ABC transporter permease [Streptomyces antibioticus]|uniref:ABC transporter permease n=1 Tax=Streptomyces antibioticus TaxID=1890 RepID=UPI0037A11534